MTPLDWIIILGLLFGPLPVALLIMFGHHYWRRMRLRRMRQIDEKALAEAFRPYEKAFTEAMGPCISD